jgi:hypothetical protein
MKTQPEYTNGQEDVLVHLLMTGLGEIDSSPLVTVLEALGYDTIDEVATMTEDEINDLDYKSVSNAQGSVLTQSVPQTCR